MFETKFTEKIKTRLMFNNLFNDAVYKTIWKKNDRAGQTMYDHGTWALHAGYLRLQTHTQNM
jgi:hypothetical protein